MTDVLAFSVFGVDWQFVKPFIVIGLAFGGVYALSGVGLVVLYRATGVLNLAFGAIGAAGALIAYYLLNHTGCPEWLAFTVCVAFGGVVNLLYGMVFGPAFARRDPLVKMMGTLGLALILLGDHGVAGAGRRRVRALPAAAELAAPLRDPRDEREPDADHLARSRDRDHGGRQRLPARDEARHRDAGARERPRDHRHARRAGAPRRGRRLVRLRPRLRRGRPHPPRPAHLARLLGLDVPRHLVARGGADRPAAIALGDDVRRARGRSRAVGAQPVRVALRVPLRRAVRARDRRAPLPLAAPRRHDLAGDDASVDATPAPGDSAAAARTAPPLDRGNDRPRRGHRCVLLAVAIGVAAARSSAPTGSRPSRASPSTRSPLSASASSTAASG